MGLREKDGYEFFADAATMETSVTIDYGQHRRLGMHLAEYAERENLSRGELREMLSMIGL